MKIIDYTTDTDEAILVKKAIYLGDYVFRIKFSDGTEKAIDLKSFLKKSAHPSLRKYLDEDNLKKYKIIHGNINWNDYEMIFPIEHLYQGKI